MQEPAGGSTLYSESQIRSRITEVAGEIATDLKGGEVYCVVILRGGVFFAVDLMRELTGFDQVELDFVKLESYSGMTSSGTVKIKGSLPRIAGKDVLVIEDMIDSGRTMECLDEALRAAGAHSVRYAVLVDRIHAHEEARVSPDYVGFGYEGDLFLYGYGLDIDGQYRALPFIGGVERT